MRTQDQQRDGQTSRLKERMIGIHTLRWLRARERPGVTQLFTVGSRRGNGHSGAARSRSHTQWLSRGAGRIHISADDKCRPPLRARNGEATTKRPWICVGGAGCSSRPPTEPCLRGSVTEAPTLSLRGHLVWIVRSKLASQPGRKDIVVYMTTGVCILPYEIQIYDTRY